MKNIEKLKTPEERQGYEEGYQLALAGGKLKDAHSGMQMSREELVFALAKQVGFIDGLCDLEEKRDSDHQP